MNFENSDFCISPFQSTSVYSPSSPYFSFPALSSIKDDFVLPKSTQASAIDSATTERFVTYNRINVTRDLIYKITKEHPNLEDLKFENCNFLDNECIQLLAPLKKLHTLSICGCQNITPLALEKIAKIDQIRNLDLSGSQRITRKDINYFLGSLPLGRTPPFTIAMDIEDSLQELTPVEQLAYKQAGDILMLNHGMSVEELYSTCFYIESLFKTQIQNNQPLYHQRKLPDLPRSVEYDPVTKNIYIHLKTRNVQEIGRGCFKTATYSILYNATPPQLVAQLTGNPTHAKDRWFNSYENEVKFLKLLNGLSGIVQTYSFTQVPYKNGQNIRYTYVQKLYNKGALSNINYNKLSRKQKEEITLSTLEGLKNLHERKITHGDFGPHQLLVEFIPSQDDAVPQAKAVIADFGEADYSDDSSIREELGRVGEVFTPFFFGEHIYYDEDKKKVNRLLKKINAKITAGTILLSVERIQQVILQMMTCTKGPADTATKAYAELKKIIDSLD